MLAESETKSKFVLILFKSIPWILDEQSYFTKIMGSELPPADDGRASSLEKHLSAVMIRNSGCAT